MNQKLSRDKVIWITGASSGIGKALANQFSQLGAKLILSSRNIENLNETKKSCKDPDKVFILPIDLEQIDQLDQKVSEAISIHGHIDILINNAGISQRARAIDTQFNIDQKIMNINFLSQVKITKLILPSMVKRKSGHIVVISSLVGKFGTPLRSTYSASKHALHGFFDSLRSEIWRDNIDISLIAPGYIKTDISINAVIADGHKYGKMDQTQANGMEPLTFAQKAVRAILKKDEEVYIGGKEIMGVYIKRFFPKLFSRMIRNILVK